MKKLISQLEDQADLGLLEVQDASAQLADLSVPETEKAEFLLALKNKGETGEELGFLVTWGEIAVGRDGTCWRRERVTKALK